MDYLTATKEQIRLAPYGSPAAVAQRFGNATSSDDFHVGDYYLHFGYGTDNKVLYALKKRGFGQNQTMSDGEIVAHLVRAKKDPVGNWLVTNTASTHANADRSYQYFKIVDEHNTAATGDFALEGFHRRVLIAYNSNWQGDPTLAMANWSPS